LGNKVIGNKGKTKIKEKRQKTKLKRLRIKEKTEYKWNDGRMEGWIVVEKSGHVFHYSTIPIFPNGVYINYYTIKN